MLSSSNDKKSLIEAMKKLTYYISNNAERQKEIFNSISKDDLAMILKNLEDDNQYLRRISALLICELLYNNKELKSEFTSKIGISAHEGRILFNRIPESLQRIPSLLKRSIELMKTQIKDGEENMFCWSINLDKKSLSLDYFEFKKYSSFTFLDPMRTLFGITIVPSRQEQSLSARLGTDGSTRSSDIQRIGDQKYLVTDRKFTDIRHSHSKEHRASVASSSAEKQRVLGYKKWRQSFSGKHPQYTETLKKPTGSNSKFGNSIQSISQYARNSHGDRKTKYFHNNMTLDDDNSRQSTNRDRSDKSPKNASIYQTMTVEVEQDKNSVNKNRQDNFYRRVKEILRK